MHTVTTGERASQTCSYVVSQVTMVLYEMLRLYGALPMIARQAKVDADLCGMKVPKGTVTGMSMIVVVE